MTQNSLCLEIHVTYLASHNTLSLHTFNQLISFYCSNKTL